MAFIPFDAHSFGSTPTHDWTERQRSMRTQHKRQKHQSPCQLNAFLGATAAGVSRWRSFLLMLTTASRQLPSNSSCALTPRMRIDQIAENRAASYIPGPGVCPATRSTNPHLSGACRVQIIHYSCRVLFRSLATTNRLIPNADSCVRFTIYVLPSSIRYHLESPTEQHCVTEIRRPDT